MILLTTPETWVTVSLILFFGILWHFGAHRFVLRKLDDKADAIRAKIEDARNLCAEAGEEVEIQERELKEAKSNAKRAIAQAGTDAEAAREAALAAFRSSLERRIAAGEQRILQEEEATRRAVRNRAIDLAVGVAGDVIGAQLTPAFRDAFVARSIERVRARTG